VRTRLPRAACRRCLEACRPGASIRALHELSVALTADALRQLRLVPHGLSTAAIAAQHLDHFYWHSVGHMLGLDTHDTATLGFNRCAGCGRDQWVWHMLGLDTHDIALQHGPCLAAAGVLCADTAQLSTYNMATLSFDKCVHGWPLAVTKAGTAPLYIFQCMEPREGAVALAWSRALLCA